MRTYDLVLNAGKDVLIDIDYKFFLVLADGGYPFDVTLYKGSINQKCEGVAAGFGLRLAAESRGKKFIFNSANTQTIKIFVGDDEAIYQRLSGTVTVNGGSLALISAVTDIVNTVKVRDDGFSYGGSYKAGTNMAVNTPDTVFTPAANVNGAIVHMANLWAYSGTQPCLPTLIAKNSSPVSIVDGDVIASVAQGQNGNGVHFEKAVRIPAGKGLYCIDNFLSSYAMRSVLYTLLP